MNKQTGQVVFGTLSIFTLLSAVIGGTGFFYKVQNDQDKRIDQVEQRIEDVNGKLDLLLENFELKYEPKYISNEA